MQLQSEINIIFVLCISDGTGHHYEGTDPGLQKIRVRTSIAQDAFMYWAHIHNIHHLR